MKLLMKVTVTVLLFQFLAACQTVPEITSVRENVNRDVIKNIRKSELLILVNNRAFKAVLSAHPSGAGSAPRMGVLFDLIADIVAAHETQNKKSRQQVQLDRISQTLSGYAIHDEFAAKLYSALRKKKFLKLTKASKKYFDDADASNQAKEKESYIKNAYAKTTADMLIVADLGYYFDERLSEYLLATEVTVFPKDSLLNKGKSHPDKDSLPVLYRNRFYYSSGYKGIEDFEHGASVWADAGGGNIRKVAESSVQSLSKLVAFDLGLYMNHKREKDLSVGRSFKSILTGVNTGNVIARSKLRSVYRRKDNFIYSMSNDLVADDLGYFKGANRATSSIYITRYSDIGSAYDLTVLLNGKHQVSLSSKTYCQLDVKPGQHTVEIEDKAKISLNVKQGYDYFLTIGASIGLFSPNVVLIPVPRHVSQPIIQKTKRVSP